MQFSHDISVQRVPHTKVQTESTQSFIHDVIWGGGRNIGGVWGVQLPDAKGYMHYWTTFCYHLFLMIHNTISVNVCTLAVGLS